MKAFTILLIFFFTKIKNDFLIKFNTYAIFSNDINYMYITIDSYIIFFITRLGCILESKLKPSYMQTMLQSTYHLF